MTSPRSSGQGDLLEDEPKSNSREDIGFSRPGSERPEGVDDRPPPAKTFGKRSPGPDPVPRNSCSSAIQIEDARKFVKWIHDQDIPTHARITLGGVVVNLSGLGIPDLRWLCQAIKQVGRAPSPELMFRAVTTRDVAVLREEPDD
ncbi:MAG: hypothetical protein IH921_01220 [Gemmatimonadetes bacterium]|nr:hypothetical protein [Gemmatimonadota bacterium]